MKHPYNDFQLVAEHSPDVICRFDREYKHLYVNPALEQATGIPVANFIGRTPHEAGLEPSFANFWIENLALVFKLGKQKAFEFSFPTPVGQKYFQTILVPEFDGGKHINRILTVTRDITDLKAQQTQTDQLIGFVSHELKNPLALLKVFSHLLQKKSAKNSDTDGAAFLAKMNTQVNKMNKLINDMLDATRINGGRLQLHNKPFNFSKLVHNVVQDFSKTTTTHRIKVKGNVNKPAFGDKDRVYQVLMNLLLNAAKYSPEASSIVITIAENGPYVQCCIQDFGIGIAKNKQQEIFKQFYRVSEQSRSGLGLGLYIAKEIVTQQGGKIWVKSRKGKGSSFYFTLPLAKQTTRSH